MNTDLSEDDIKALQYKLRIAAFNYFLGNLSLATPAHDVAVLADELVSEANKMLVAYFHSKGIP